MPRRARVKSIYAIYHVTCRSISEIMLFTENADKEYYLKLLKKYLERYRCSLYAYCLMSNHIHLQLDTRGFDISTFMHSLNTAYVRYFNKKYNRHGHLFQDRFGSKILNSDAYNLAVSAYIHNNPKDIPDYSGHEEDYIYSSYGIYLGTMPDCYGIVDTSFIKGFFNTVNHDSFNKRYHEFVKLRNDISDISDISDTSDILDVTEMIDMTDIVPEAKECEYVSGRTVIIREGAAADIIAYVSKRLEIIHQTTLSLKSRQKSTKFRAFIAYALRVLCNLSYKNICRYILNITVTSCSRLCSKGYDLVCKDNFHLQVFNELVTNVL